MLDNHTLMHQTNAMTDAQLDLITTEEAARLLGINRSTITRWVKSGKLEPERKLPGTKGPYLFKKTTIRQLTTK